MAPKWFSYFVENIPYSIQTIGLRSPDIKCFSTSVDLCFWRGETFEKAALVYCQRTDKPMGLCPGTGFPAVDRPEMLSSLCLSFTSWYAKELNRARIKTNYLYSVMYPIIFLGRNILVSKLRKGIWERFKAHSSLWNASVNFYSFQRRHYTISNR